MATRTKAAAKSQHPLADHVPDMEIMDRYKSRYIKGIKDMQLLGYAHESGNNVLLFGDTGPGKSMMVRAYCAINGIPLVTVACNGGIDPNSFFSSVVPDYETGGIKDQDSTITEIIQHGGCLFFEEPNFMPPKTAAVFYPLLREGFITILEQGNRMVKAHPDLFIVAAYNPDYDGTRPLNKAFKNRFTMKLNIDYDPDVESQLVWMPVLLELANQLRIARKANDLDTPVSTNMLMEFERYSVDLGLDFAIENFLGAFDADERDAVRTVFEMHTVNLTDQLQQMIEESEAQDD